MINRECNFKDDLKRHLLSDEGLVMKDLEFIPRIEEVDLILELRGNGIRT